MSSIITNNFRLENLRAMQASLADTVNNSFYLCIGKVTAWPDESNPPTPADSVTAARDIWDELLAGKKVTDTETRQGIYLRPWTTGQYYDMYRHDYDGTVAGVSLVGAATTPDTLYDANYYVVDPVSLRVYKCLYNRSHTTNLPVASTVMPTTTAIAPETTADGYVWKYMYTVPAGDAANYNTPSFIPSYDTDINSVSANDGGIYAIVVDNAGAYTVAPTVVITGDGTGAAATASLAGGGVAYITVTNPGSGYTHANITFTGGTGGGGTLATAIISPFGGHATNPAEELGGIYLIIARKLTGDEGGDFTVATSYRQLALLKNPTLAAALVTSGTARLCRQMEFQANATPANSFPAGTAITGGTSGAEGVVVDYDAANKILRYVLTETGGGDWIDFANNEVVTGGANSATTKVSGGVVGGEADEHTGSIIYYENRRAVARDAAQTEDVRLVIEF